MRFSLRKCVWLREEDRPTRTAVVLGGEPGIEDGKEERRRDAAGDASEDEDEKIVEVLRHARDDVENLACLTYLVARVR